MRAISRVLVLVLCCIAFTGIVFGKSSSSTTLASSSNPSTYGNSVTFTATVTPSAATGTVTFKDGTTTLGTGTLSSGKATFSTSTLAAGSHSVTAAYGGDTNYNTSTSSALTQTVNKANTTVTLASSANPSTYASSVTFTATISPSAATGTVTFKDGTTTLGTGTLSSGKATFSTSTLTAGSHSITASYGGSTNYNTSTSSTLTQTVNKANTTLTLASSANPSTYGSSVTFTATISPSAASGTVTFLDGSTTLGTGTVSSGKATLAISSLIAGSHSITVSYGGSTNYNTSTSSTLTQTVNKKNTTVTVVSSLNPSALGSSVTFTATVSPSAATGTVTFTDGSTTLGTGTVSSGTATFSTSALALGSHSIKAAYGGDANYNSSTSSTLTQTVRQPSTVALTSWANPAPYAATLTFTATISPSAATGTVTFYDSGATLGTGTLTGGRATYATSALTVGSHSITATYGGNSTYVSSTSPTLAQSVLTVTSITVTPATVSLPIGASQRFTATGTFSDSSQGNISAVATWTSSDSTVATVSAAGVATGIAEGPATIQAAVGTINASASLTGTPSKFRFTGSLVIPRNSHTATLLQNGKVLIVGGSDINSNFIGPSELYDPATGNFTVTRSLLYPRFSHTATLLQNGKVLITGGTSPGSGGTTYAQPAAELYDPATGSFAYAGSLNIARSLHTATLLQNGQVLIVGGSGDNTAELYDPTAGTFTYTGSLSIALSAQSATLLNDGTVLIAGGSINQVSTSVAGAEIYNPTTGTFSATGSLNTAREFHTATLLTSGKVLIATGTNSQTGLLGTAELYDPVVKAFTVTGNPAYPRGNAAAAALNSGQVLIAGGSNSNGLEVDAAELYDPTSATFSLAGDLNIQRYSNSGTLLNDGTVLIAGGFDEYYYQGGYYGELVPQAEIYQSTGQPPPPDSIQITPASANVIVGGTQQFNALDNRGNQREDVTWTVSNPSLASVTADENDNAILTGLAAGQVTLTANAETTSAQIQITILAAGAYPPGTAIWSAPAVPGFSPIQLVQAVPTASGPDLYSIQLSNDGTQSVVQALTADGRQLWQTTLPPLNKNSVPDGGGGLLVTEYDTCTSGQTNPMTVVDLSPVDGQPAFQIAAAGLQQGNKVIYCYGNGYDAPQIAVRGDGAIIISEPTNVGFPPLTLNGATFPIPPSTSTINGVTINVQCCTGPPMVNSDGTAYAEYEVRNIGDTGITSDTLYLFYIPTSGSWGSTVLSSTTQNQALLPGPIIPDGQGGIIATWTISPSNPPVPQYPYQAVDVVGGAVGTPYNLPFSPTKVFFGQSPTLVLGENGTAFGTNGTDTTNGPVVASFNVTSGAVNWTYQASPQSTLSIMAVISDGSLAINDSQNGIIQLSTSGAPSAVSGSLGGIAHYSWGGNWYVQGSQAASAIALPLDVDAADIWATPSGSPSQNGGPDALCECELQSTATAPVQPQSAGEVLLQSATIPTCPVICNLPSPVYPATSCTTLAGTGPTYLIFVGDPGLPPHNTGYGFPLAAQQNANELQANGNKVIVCRVSSVTDLNQALTTNGFIGGGLIYYGHSGPYLFSENPKIIFSILAIGQASGGDTNLTYNNVNEVCPSGCSSILDPNITFTINGCRAGMIVTGDPSDATGISATPIAKILARRLNIRVTGYAFGTYFSLKNAANATSNNWTGEPNPLPTSTPMYLIPEGAHGNKKPPLSFCAVGSCKN